MPRKLSHAARLSAGSKPTRSRIMFHAAMLRAHPPVEVPSPGRPSTEGRNISAEPTISGAVVSLQSARTYIPRPTCVLPRVPDYSEDNTSFPKILLASSRGQEKILSPTLEDRKYAEGFPRDRWSRLASHPVDNPPNQGVL
jgi:hypothetical protein